MPETGSEWRKREESKVGRRVKEKGEGGETSGLGPGGGGRGGGGEGQLWFEEKVKHLLDKPLVALTY